MKDKILNGIIGIIKNKQDINNVTFNEETELSALNINSITFIEIVVALESEFNFEFDYEMLLNTKFPTIRTMIEYVESKVKTNAKICDYIADHN
jgi:acyl carrier protein